MSARRVKISTPEAMRAFNHGQQAAWKGRHLADNPYRPASDGDLWRAWNRGYADKGTSKSARAQRNRVRAVVERDGRVCWLCLKPIADESSLTLDHVLPRSKGGGRTRENLRPAHAKCNRQRGNGPPPELLLTADMMLKVLEAA